MRLHLSHPFTTLWAKWMDNLSQLHVNGHAICPDHKLPESLPDLSSHFSKPQHPTTQGTGRHPIVVESQYPTSLWQEVRWILTPSHWKPQTLDKSHRDTVGGNPGQVGIHVYKKHLKEITHISIFAFRSCPSQQFTTWGPDLEPVEAMSLHTIAAEKKEFERTVLFRFLFKAQSCHV